MIKITNVYAEMTPNPSTMKFVADRMIVPADGIAEYFSMAEAKGSSELAEKLFAFPFVKAVFITNNFVTITKNDSLAWDFVTMELREFILDYVRKNEFAIQAFPKRNEETGEEIGYVHTQGSHTEPQTEMDAKIIAILDEYVRPAVENDGGAIHFRAYEEGTVKLALRGSCSGCPSSMVTLKSGVETLMKQMLPEVKEVVAYEE
jgi:NFU1 iron-sulfur cluster scaffold homolog, mitochondrial